MVTYMGKEFSLCQGVYAEGTEGLKSSYRLLEQGAEGLLSADAIADCARGFIKMIAEPVFFFLELPEDMDGDGKYSLYYLDNCTKAVAEAIMKRYGELLVNDGAARFGFGSNKTDEEIYFTDYQEFSIYTKRTAAMEKLLASVGAVKTDKPDSIWELLSEENQGSLSVVEIEGETVFDIPDNLKQAGMYKAESV